MTSIMTNPSQATLALVDLLASFLPTKKRIKLRKKLELCSTSVAVVPPVCRLAETPVAPAEPLTTCAAEPPPTVSSSRSPPPPNVSLEGLVNFVGAQPQLATTTGAQEADFRNSSNLTTFQQQLLENEHIDEMLRTPPPAAMET